VLEIELVLSAHISAVLKELQEPHYLLDGVKNCILKALETDADWVLLYNATKELHLKSSSLPDPPQGMSNGELVKNIAGIVVDVSDVLNFLSVTVFKCFFYRT